MPKGFVGKEFLEQHDFPKWENARYHYDIWVKPDENGFSLLDGILRNLVEIERETDILLTAADVIFRTFQAKNRLLS